MTADKISDGSIPDRQTFEVKWLEKMGPRPPSDGRDDEVRELNWLVARNTALTWYRKGYKDAMVNNTQ